MPSSSWFAKRRRPDGHGAGVNGADDEPRRSQAKQHLVAALSEFIGTTLFLFFAFGGTNVALSVAGPADPVSKLLYISLAFGLSLLVNVWAFFRIGGGMFNPAVALGMWIIGAINFVRLGLVVVAQILGGIVAAALIDGLLPGPLVVSTRLSPGVSIAQGLFLEMFLTAELIFVIFMLATERHRVAYTGGSLNPARSFGPAVVTASFDTYHWIYWAGPVLGAFLATGLYSLTKVLDARAVTGDVDDPDYLVVYKDRPHESLEAGIQDSRQAQQSAV